MPIPDPHLNLSAIDLGRVVQVLSADWGFEHTARANLERLPDFAEPITLHVNGCPNSCARFQTADIGLKGSIVDDQEGFQVHLGGRLGENAGFGRKERGLKVTAEDSADYVERVLRNYLADRTDGEVFATWARRADASLLT